MVQYKAMNSRDTTKYMELLTKEAKFVFEKKEASGSPKEEAFWEGALSALVKADIHFRGIMDNPLYIPEEEKGKLVLNG